MARYIKKALSTLLTLMLVAGLLAIPGLAAAPNAEAPTLPVELTQPVELTLPVELTQPVEPAQPVESAQAQPAALTQSGAPASYSAGYLTATPTASTVLVDGRDVAFDAYNIGGNNYFKLRDIAYTINGTPKQFYVGWDADNNAITLTAGRRYTSVGGEMARGSTGAVTPTPTRSTIYLNGREVQLTAYNIGGNNYFKLRDIGMAFNFAVDWDGARSTIVIDTGRRYTDENGAFTYSGSYFGAAQGSAKFLEGKSVLVSIFVSGGPSSWSTQEVNSAAQTLATSTNWIISEGLRYGKNVELISDFTANPDLRYNMTYTGDFYALVDEYNDDADLAKETNERLYNFIEENIPYLALADKYGTDSIGYVIYYNNINGRDYNFLYDNANNAERYHEKAVIIGGDYRRASVVAHEILHLFGAADLYFARMSHGVSRAMLEYCSQNYPDDIMVSTWIYDSSGNVVYDRILREITPITAYLLGLVDEIAEFGQFPELRRVVKSAFVNRMYDLNGFAMWEFNNGHIYEGNWVEGQMSGQGTYEWPTGNVYVGNFENHRRSGYGVLVYASGDRYEGNWVDDRMSGQGTYTWDNGNVYVGNFENSVRSGYGEFSLANGNRYEGNWENDKMSGQGTYTWANGSVYVGSFENGVRSGYGVMTFADGRVQAGMWADDSFVG